MIKILQNFFKRPDVPPHNSIEAAATASAQSPTQALPDGSQPIQLAPLVRGLQPLMRLGIYELSKTPERCGEAIDFTLPKEGKATVSVGAAGMPTVFDFDFVILLASQITHLNNLHDGEPPRALVMRVADMLKYCQRHNSDREAARLEKSLERLTETKFEASYWLKRNLHHWEPDGFLSDFEMLSRTKRGKPSVVRIQVPDWMYDWIVISKGRQTLPLTPQYFQISSGVGRYLYLLASTAGDDDCIYWPRQKIYANSGSQLPLDRFWDSVCEQVRKKAIPDFEMMVIQGNNEPILVMRRQLEHYLTYSRYHPVQ